MAYRNATLRTTSSPLAWLKAPSSALACGALALLLATTALPQHAAAQVTDKQIDDFIKANANNPDAIAKAMKDYNVDVNRIKQATGHSQATVDKFVADSNSEQLKEVTKGQTSNTVTNKQIDDFIKANANDPDAIAKAMKDYNVDVNRIKQATGHSQATVDKYVADSNSEQLKEVTRGQTSNTITNKQIDDFIKANANDPDAIAKAMQEYNVDVNRIKQATGHSQATVDKYVADSNSEQLREVTRGQTSNTVTNKQIDEFVRVHGDDPKAIADAMKEYNVDLARIQQATGFSRDEMTNYINNSRDPNLKLALVDWPHAKTGNADYDKLPEFMKAGVFSGQPTVTIRDASEIDKLPFWSSMHPDAAASYKKLLQERLDAGDGSSTGMSVMGLMGYQIRIPERGNPERTYPPVSASELATMKAELQRIQEPAIAAQKALLTCLDTGKSDCAKERTAYDAVRLPSIYQATKVQIAEFERTQLTTTNSNELFFASITPSLTAHNAFLQCAQTAKVTKASCDEHSELAIDMSKKVEALSKNVYEECVKTYGGSNTPQCRPLYMQYDAQRSNTTKLTQRVNEFKAEEYARKNDDVKTSTTSPTAPKTGGEEWFALSGSALNDAYADPIKLTGKLNGLSQADYDRITSGNYNVSELAKLDPADQVAAIVRYHQVGQPDVARNQLLNNAIAEVFSLNGSRLHYGKDLDNISVKAGVTNPTLHAEAGLYVDGKYIGTPYTTNWNSAAPFGEYYKMAIQYLREAQAAKVEPGKYTPKETYSNKDIAAFDYWSRSEDLTKPRDYDTWVKLGRPGLDKLQENAASTNAAQVKPTTLTLPAAGKTRTLANGYSIDSSGAIKNAKGQTIAALGEDGVFRNAAGKPVRAGTAQTLTKLVAETTQATSTVANSGTAESTAQRSTPIPNDNRAFADDVDDAAEQANKYVAEKDPSGTFYGDNNSDLSSEVSKLKLPENTAVANKDGSIITNAEINSFIRANVNDPKAIADAMKKYGVDLNRIQEATGYTREEMVDYIKKSKNSYLKTALGKWTTDKSTDAAADANISNAQVDGYIRANLNDPAKIASAMLKHNVSLDRVQLATGYSRAQITDYIKKSRSPELKKMLENWKKSPTPSGVSDADINNFIRGNLNSPETIAKAMKKYKVDLTRIQTATGYSHQEMADYINKSGNAYLKDQLKKWAAVKPIVEPKPPTLETGQPTLTKPTPMLPPTPETGQPQAHSGEAKKSFIPGKQAALSSETGKTSKHVYVHSLKEDGTAMQTTISYDASGKRTISGKQIGLKASPEDIQVSLLDTAYARSLGRTQMQYYLDAEAGTVAPRCKADPSASLCSASVPKKGGAEVILPLPQRD